MPSPRVRETGASSSAFTAQARSNRSKLILHSNDWVHLGCVASPHKPENIAYRVPGGHTQRNNVFLLDRSLWWARRSKPIHIRTALASAPTRSLNAYVSRRHPSSPCTLRHKNYPSPVSATCAKREHSRSRSRCLATALRRVNDGRKVSHSATVTMAHFSTVTDKGAAPSASRSGPALRVSVRFQRPSAGSTGVFDTIAAHRRRGVFRFVDR